MHYILILTIYVNLGYGQTGPAATVTAVEMSSAATCEVAARMWLKQQVGERTNTICVPK